MDWFEKVKRYFDKGIYVKEQVKIFVQTGKITSKQYKEITSENYIV